MRRSWLVSSCFPVALVVFPAVGLAHGPAAGAGRSEDPPAIERPKVLDRSHDEQTSESPEADKAPDDESVPAGGDSPPPGGEPPAPSDASAAPPNAPTLPTSEASTSVAAEPIRDDLLAPSEPDPVSPAVTDPPPMAETEPALISRYRPASNPGRFNMSARALFAYAGPHRGEGGGGRLAGASLDVGQSWNAVGYALTVSASGGRVSLEDGAKVSTFLGAGPTLGLGRLGMVSRGVLDLRVGYDFFWVRGVQTDVDTGTSADRIYAPHGPRVRLDLGLSTTRTHSPRFWHAFGVSLGWQALVHDLSRDFPVSSVLSVGLLYWLG